MKIKERVVGMRKKGFTFGQIRKIYLIPKSTLSNWCEDLPKPKHLYYKNRIQWLNLIRKKSVKVNKKKREDKVQRIIEGVKKEVNKWTFLNSKQTQKGFLSLLYWAEGQKLPVKSAPVKFVNTDPKLMLLFLTMLRNCYQLDESKLKARLHLHWYHNEKKVRHFWSKLLDIDESLFTKTYFKPRSKTKRFRRNFAGICFVTYGSVDLRWEIMQTGYNIQEKISGKVKNWRS